MRIVETLLSACGAMIAMVLYLDIYMNQTLSGNLYLSVVGARHWTLQYIINTAGWMAILSQLFYKETAKQAYYAYISFLVSSIAFTEYPIMQDGGCQFVTMVNSAIFSHCLYHEATGFHQKLLELRAERLAKLQ